MRNILHVYFDGSHAERVLADVAGRKNGLTQSAGKYANVAHLLFREILHSKMRNVGRECKCIGRGMEGRGIKAIQPRLAS
jgi:hypothetical protein